MTKSSFKKILSGTRIKDGALRVSSNVLLRMEIATEEARQTKRFKKLGERVFQVLADGNLEQLKEDRLIVELLGALQETKKTIDSMREKLRTSEKESEEI